MSTFVRLIASLAFLTALAANAGANVQLTGDVATDGKTITVTKIAPVAK